MTTTTGGDTLETVDSPHKVPDLLRQLACDYRDAEQELRSAWQEDTPKGWGILAGALDFAAAQAEAGFKRSGL